MRSEGVLALSGQTSVLQAGGCVQNHSQQTENQLVQILCHQHHPGNILMERCVSETEQSLTPSFVLLERKLGEDSRVFSETGFGAAGSG